MNSIEKNESKFKQNMALVGLIITIIAFIIPAVMAYGKLNEKVENNEELIKFDNRKTFETIKNIESQLLLVETKLAGTEVSVLSIKEDIGEIKADIRLIANTIVNQK